jgi:hypothetical protein
VEIVSGFPHSPTLRRRKVLLCRPGLASLRPEPEPLPRKGLLNPLPGTIPDQPPAQENIGFGRGTQRSPGKRPGFSFLELYRHLRVSSLQFYRHFQAHKSAPNRPLVVPNLEKMWNYLDTFRPGNRRLLALSSIQRTSAVLLLSSDIVYPKSKR